MLPMLQNLRDSQKDVFKLLGKSSDRMKIMDCQMKTLDSQMKTLDSQMKTLDSQMEIMIQDTNEIQTKVASNKCDIENAITHLKSFEYHFREYHTNAFLPSPSANM
jgi:uncharacterized protein YoxC